MKSPEKIKSEWKEKQQHISIGAPSPPILFPNPAEDRTSAGARTPQLSALALSGRRATPDVVRERTLAEEFSGNCEHYRITTGVVKHS